MSKFQIPYLIGGGNTKFVNIGLNLIEEILFKLNYYDLIRFFKSNKLICYEDIYFWRNYLNSKNIKYHKNNSIDDLKRLSYLNENFCFDTELESYFISNDYMNRGLDEEEKEIIIKDFIEQMKTDVSGYNFGFNRTKGEFEFYLHENWFEITSEIDNIIKFKIMRNTDFSNIENIFKLIDNIEIINELNVSICLAQYMYINSSFSINITLEEFYNIIEEICKIHNFKLCEYIDDDMLEEYTILYENEEYSGDCVAISKIQNIVYGSTHGVGRNYGTYTGQFGNYFN